MKYKNSFDYIGAELANDSILATEVSKSAFDSLKDAAIRVQNVPFNYSKGNLFEFVLGAKLKVEAAEKGHILNYEPVNAARGLYSSPDDLNVFYKGEKICFQSKVGDLEYTAKEFANPKYAGMERVTTSDMYGSVKRYYEEKIQDGSIAKDEYDAYINLKEGIYDPETGAIAKVSSAEIEQFRGADNKVDVNKVAEYIEIQQNRQFLDECINNTASVTMVSAISSCVFSSVKNFYKYLKNEQDSKTTFKNIGKDVIKGTGHGLLSSSIANVVKFGAFKTGNAFFRNNVNSLVVANGAINLGKSFYYFSKGRLSFNDLLVNVSASSFLTLANLGINFVLPGAPLIKLASSIVLNMVCSSFLRAPTEGIKLKKVKRNEIINDLISLTNSLNEDLKTEFDSKYELLSNVYNFCNDTKMFEDEGLTKQMFKKLGIEDKFISKEEFKNKIKNGEKIVLKF